MATVITMKTCSGFGNDEKSRVIATTSKGQRELRVGGLHRDSGEGVDGLDQ